MMYTEVHKVVTLDKRPKKYNLLPNCQGQRAIHFSTAVSSANHFTHFIGGNVIIIK